LGTKINDTIGGGGVFVPLGPPACGMVGEGFVRWVTEKKVTVVHAGSKVVGTVRVRCSLREINGDEVPAGAKGSWGTV
jgi:hypothetical protein